MKTENKATPAAYSIQATVLDNDATQICRLSTTLIYVNVELNSLDALVDLVELAG